MQMLYEHMVLYACRPYLYVRMFLRPLRGAWLAARAARHRELYEKDIAQGDAPCTHDVLGKFHILALGAVSGDINKKINSNIKKQSNNINKMSIKSSSLKTKMMLI